MVIAVGKISSTYVIVAPTNSSSRSNAEITDGDLRHEVDAVLRADGEMHSLELGVLHQHEAIEQFVVLFGRGHQLGLDVNGALTK